MFSSVQFFFLKTGMLSLYLSLWTEDTFEVRKGWSFVCNTVCLSTKPLTYPAALVAVSLKDILVFYPFPTILLVSEQFVCPIVLIWCLCVKTEF